MKKIVFITLILLSSLSSYSQSDTIVINLSSYSQVDSAKIIKELREDIRMYKLDGWTQLGVGLFAHGLGCSSFISGPLSDPDVASGFIMYNTIGVSFDVLAIVQFTKARKLKKKLKNITS
jgi:hypothetical protein